MTAGCKFGTHRVVEPINSLPQPAWKLDNSMIIYDNEVLVQVEALNVNSISFTQIYNECEGDVEKIADKLLRIVESRGKLHNPITGTGGMLIGTIKQIGNGYDNADNIKAGDRIVSLVSLSLTPLKIRKIKKIHVHLAQVEVEAEAILFQSSPMIKAPADLPAWEVMAVLDEAGAPMQTWNLVNTTDQVMILGAGGKLGLLCAFAAKQKLGPAGKLWGLVKTRQSYERLKNTTIFDKVICADALLPIKALQEIGAEVELADITVNCINLPGTEALSVLITKDKGSAYFAHLASNYNVAALTAEGIGRDLAIFTYKGYLHGHAEFAINLLRNNPELRILLSSRVKTAGRQLRSKQVLPSLDLEPKILKDIGLESYVFESPEIKQVLKNALRVANYDCTVLITGESGAGKEIFAQITHKASSRCNSSLVRINCGSIPQNLLEAELFGYEGGAFTSAKSSGKMGIFEVAKAGTLFLDEIGELPNSLQVKLLRAIQEKEIYRVGGIKPIKVDVRIVAATNKNLRKMVEDGQFREDLFYRLNVFPIHIPPLRKRKQDIIPLTNFFLEKYNKQFRLKKSLTPSALSCLVDYSWPGNIRELENLIQRLLINSINDSISEIDIMANLRCETTTPGSMPQESVAMKTALAETEYHILKEAKKRFTSTREMAKYLNLSQATLIRRLKKYNL